MNTEIERPETDEITAQIVTAELIDEIKDFCKDKLDSDFWNYKDKVDDFFDSYELLSENEPLDEAAKRDYWNDQTPRGNYYCDVASEWADSQVNIYYSDLWAQAKEFREWTERAFEEGYIDPTSKDFTLEEAFQAGEYLFYLDLANSVFNSINEYFHTEFPAES
jgi:hypothetical protein